MSSPKYEKAYSYGYGESTRYYGRDRDYRERGKKQSLKVVVCKQCKHGNVRGAEDKSVFKCPQCETMLEPNGYPADVNFHNEFAGDDVKLNTHIQIRWKCRACACHGIRWIKKKQNKSALECRDCGAKMLMIRTLPNTGAQTDIWGQPDIRTAIPHKMLTCPQCGYNHTYNYARPTTCGGCLEDLPE